MADQRINIAIGSTYNGAGTNAAIGNLGKMSTTASKAAGAVGRLASSFDEVDGSVGRVISQFAHLSSALVAGGGFGAAIAGISALVGVLKEAYDEAEKAREELEKHQFESATQGIDSYRIAVEKLATALEEAARFQKEFNATLNKIENIGSSIQATEALIEGEKGGTDESRAQAKVEATRLQGQQNVKNAEDTKEQARKDWKMADRLHEEQKKAVASLEKSVVGWSSRADKYEQEHKGNWDEDSQKEYMNLRKHQLHAEDELVKAKDKEAKLLNDTLAAYNKYVASDKAIEEAKKKAELANIRAENDLAELKQKQADKEAKAKERAQKEKDADEKGEADKKHREEVTQKKKEIRKNGQKQIDDLREKTRKEIQQLDKEIKKAKEQLRDAIKREREAYDNESAAHDVADTLSNNGVYAPNGVDTGRPRGAVGPESNDTDNPNGGVFAQSKSFLLNWARSHPDQAAAQGIIAPFNSREQDKANRIAGKLASGQELNKDEKAWWDANKDRDPERIKQKAEREREKAEKEREKKEQEIAKKEQERETKRETMYTNIQYIKDNMEKALGKVN